MITEKWRINATCRSFQVCHWSAVSFWGLTRWRDRHRYQYPAPVLVLNMWPVHIRHEESKIRFIIGTDVIQSINTVHSVTQSVCISGLSTVGKTPDGTVQSHHRTSWCPISIQPMHWICRRLFNSQFSEREVQRRATPQDHLITALLSGCDSHIPRSHGSPQMQRTTQHMLYLGDRETTKSVHSVLSRESPIWVRKGMTHSPISFPCSSYDKH